MNENEVKVSVVIPTFNRADAALHCAKSVLASDFNEGIEIVVVDDCSSKCVVADAIGDRLPKDGRIRFVRHERNKNLAAARNTGGRMARGKYIFFLDDDNELRPDVIRKLASVLDAGRYAVAAPLAVNTTPSGEKTVWASSFAFSEWMSIPRNVDANVPYTDDYAEKMRGRVIDTWYSSNGYMVRREIFERLGGFYEWFGIYMEESDFCMRVREDGGKVCVVGDAVTWHRHYDDAGDPIMRRFATNTPRKAFLMSRNRLHFALRHYTLPQVLSIMFVFAPLITGRYFFMALFRGWPKIGLGFAAGYLTGFAQVLGRLLTFRK